MFSEGVSGAIRGLPGMFVLCLSLFVCVIVCVIHPFFSTLFGMFQRQKNLRVLCRKFFWFNGLKW